MGMRINALLVFMGCLSYVGESQRLASMKWDHGEDGMR